MAQQLEEVPGVSPSAVREVYGRLAREGLLAVDDDQRTWVAHTARPAADPHPPLPPGWVEELRHTLTPEGADRTAWFTQTLHAHIAPLPPGTRLPSSRELGERLKDLKLPATAPERAYRQLAAERLLVTKGGKGTYVADPEPADRAARSAAPQTAEAALPPDWVEELRRTLHTTPKPEGVDHTTWLAQALHAHIASLPPGTRLPTHRRLGERLKDLGFGRGTVQKAYERLRKTGQLTSKFGDGTWVADPGAPLKQAAGSGSSRAVAAAAPPEPGHLEEPGPGGVAAAEPPPWAGQQPQESQPPQRPAHAAGATEGVAGAASDGGPGPGDPWPSGDTETDATSAIAPRPLPVAGAPEAPWGSGVLHRGAGPSAPEGSLGALERAGGDALLAGGDAWEAPPEPSDSGIRGILAFLARDDRGLPARDAAGHIGLPHPPEAPPEAAFGPAEPGSLPVLSAPLDPAHAAPGPGPGRSPHPAPLPDWLEGLRYALTSRTPSPARRLAHALRTLIRKGDLTPGMRLPGQGELVRQLQHPEIGRKAVKGAYAQLGKEGLLTTEKRKGTWVAGAAGDPPPSLPADWLEGLQRALKEHPLLEETLREHVQGLPYGTLLPPHEEMAQQLEEVPGVSPSAVREVYGRLAREGLLAVDDDQRTWVAHTARPAADPHPRPPFGWVEELRHTLEHNPKPEGTTHTTWLTQVLRAHIASLPPRHTPAVIPKAGRAPEGPEASSNRPGTRVPPAGRRAPAGHQGGQSKGGKGTYVADPEPADRAARPGASRVAAAALPESSHPKEPGPSISTALPGPAAPIRSPRPTRTVPGPAGHDTYPAPPVYWLEELRRELTTGTASGFNSTRLADALRTRIEDGRLQPGMLLPPYEELAQHLGVGASIAQMAYIRLAGTRRLLLKQDSSTQVAPLEEWAPATQLRGDHPMR